ncbi:MAG: glycosyltransferase family 4 protein [Candidatus Krumholzibacteriia bacterium]
MRVLVFSSLYPNSVMPQFGLFVHRRVEAVAHRGVAVRVVAPGPWFPRILPIGRWRGYARLPKRERLAGLAVTHPRYLHPPGLGMYVQARNLYRAALPHLRTLRREFDFDVIDAHYMYPDGVAAAHLARRLGVPCVLTARGSDINLLPRFAMVRRQIVKAMHRADALVAVSGALADAMSRLGAESRKMHVVPNGIDRRRFSYGDPLVAREKLEIYSDENMLLSVGNLNELKGHVLMIEAVARLQHEGIRTSLHIFGEGEERPRLEARIAELGLARQVVLHGSFPNERLGRWYRAASVFVLASSREGWPNVLNEALACGLPVVSTSAGGVPEIVTHGESGLLVQERSAEAIAAALRAALQRSWDRRQIAARASSRGWSDVADQLVQIFSSVTKPAGVPGPGRPDAAAAPASAASVLPA